MARPKQDRHGVDEETALRLVVGLGNPGRDYEGTRHNIGFEILDRLVAARGLDWKRERKWKAEVAKEGQLIFLKPQTFMNLSGQAVAAVTGFHKLPPASLLVVYDDLDLPLGRLRFRRSGSPGGHNGLKSIQASIGSDAYGRLKFGIGRATPEAGTDGRGERTVSHVLGRFSPEEREDLEKSVAKAVEAVNDALSRGLGAAMNEHNRKEQQQKPRPKQKAKPATATPAPPSPAEPRDSGTTDTSSREKEEGDVNEPSADQELS